MVAESWEDAEVETLSKVMKQLSSKIRWMASKSSGSHGKRVALLKSMVVFKPSTKKQRTLIVKTFDQTCAFLPMPLRSRLNLARIEDDGGEVDGPTDEETEVRVV